MKSMTGKRVGTNVMSQNKNILDIHSTPIYVTNIGEFDKTSMKEAVKTLVSQSNFDKNDPSYFGDIYNHIKQPHELDCFSTLNKFISKSARKYVNKIGTEQMLDVYVQKSWAVELSTNGIVKPHRHINAHLSCVFYIQTFEDYGGELVLDSGVNLLDFLPIDNKNRTYTFKPNEGDLIIFPSNLLHYVNISRSLGKRYCVSYDLMVTTEDRVENKTLDPKFWKKI